MPGFSQKNRVGNPIAFLLSLLLFLGVFATPSSAEGTLQRVQEEGVLRCGVTLTGKGLAARDSNGTWRGFFPDFCRVVASAVIGDSEAVEFFQVDEVTRFTALNEDQIDILVANTTWTAGRDSRLGMAFPAIYYYDGTGFMIHQSRKTLSLDTLEEATICVGQNTTTIMNLRDLVKQSKPDFKIAAHHSLEAQLNAFYQNKCDMIAYDRLGLIAHQAKFEGPGAKPLILPEVISKEPLGPAVRDDDMAWFDAVRWAVYATIAAEEMGLNQKTIQDQLASKNADIAHFTGQQGSIGPDLGLPQDWALKVILQVGHYGEIFERNLGTKLARDEERGLNRLWTKGGLLYAPPIR